MKSAIDFESHLARIGILLQFIAVLGITFPLRSLIYGNFGLVLIGLFIVGVILLSISRTSLWVKMATPVIFVVSFIPFIFFWLILLGNMMPEAKCDNANPVFEKYPIESKEYKDEIVRLLQAYPSENVSYWIKDYVDYNHMSVYIQSKHICAVGHFRVDDWENELEYLKQEKEWPDGNCEIWRFKYDIVQTPDNTELIFRDMLGIVDCD